MLLILVKVAIILGLDRVVQGWVLEQGWYEPIANFEEGLAG